MKSTHVIGIVAGLALSNIAALAQTVVIAPDRRGELRQYIEAEKVRPYATQERIIVGSELPTSAELSDFPAKWGDLNKKYKYVYSNNNVYIVEPGTRRVIEVIE